MRFAYFGFPHSGGTHSVYRQLRCGLRPYGVEVSWLSAGASAHAAAADPAWTEEWKQGRVLGSRGDNEEQQAIALLRHLEAERPDGVFVNVFADRAQMNLARYLPRDLLRIMIVHSITPATYGAARAIRDHVHAAVGVSDRIRDDLVQRFGFDPAWTVTINNAVTDRGTAARTPPPDGQLRLLFLGRIEDGAKGVLWLPAILDRLPPSVTLTVVGSGPDLSRLERECSRLGGRVRFVGSVPPDRVGEVYANHDVLIAPSRYEGFMITLVEAMAAGCVPVASHIRGVTDRIVENGQNGFLFPIGDVRAAADRIRHLLEDRALLATMAAASPKSVEARFSLPRMAAEYFDLIQRIARQPRVIAAPMPIEAWTIPSLMAPSWRTYMPRPVKNFLRGVRERALA